MGYKKRINNQTLENNYFDCLQTRLGVDDCIHPDFTSPRYLKKKLFFLFPLTISLIIAVYFERYYRVS